MLWRVMVQFGFSFNKVEDFMFLDVMAREVLHIDAQLQHLCVSSWHLAASSRG